MLTRCPKCGHPNDITPRDDAYTVRCTGCECTLRVPARKKLKPNARRPAPPAEADAGSVFDRIAEDAAARTPRGADRRRGRRRRSKAGPFAVAVVAVLAIAAACVAFIPQLLSDPTTEGISETAQAVDATPPQDKTNGPSAPAEPSHAPAEPDHDSVTESASEEPSPVITLDAAWQELAATLARGKLDSKRLADPPAPLAGLLGGHLQRIRLRGVEAWAVWFEDETQCQKAVSNLENGEVLLPEESFPDSWVGPMRIFRSGNWILLHASLDQTVHELLPQLLGSPLAYTPRRDDNSALATLPTIKQAASSEETPAETARASDAESSPAQTRGVNQESETITWSDIEELYDKGKLLRLKSYQEVRRFLASEFERAHADVIEQAWGRQDSAFSQWVANHPDIREEFLLALDPQHDNLSQALTLFKTLYDQFPDEFDSYANLAIAISVTWDQPRASSSDQGPKRQARASDGGEPADALANFRYYVETEPVMQGRIRYLPWEMLVHVVNHRTPLDERQWALQNYLPHRQMIGKCYHDVPYDYASLKQGSSSGKLFGQPYTLPNIRSLGGVCAHQADFSSRVARSIGVPAAYVTGQNRYGDNHAWVMWVELKQVTAKGIAFTLESHGRYRGDMYYVGHLTDPQTAQRITDRELELYLHSVGVGPLARRHAARLMAIYPRLCDSRELTPKQRLTFLRDVLTLSAGYDETWRALAAMASEPEVRETQKQQMKAVLDTLFRTFANYPDFTWEVFGDLVAYEEDAEKQNGLYVRLINLYEQAKRPDLAFEARLVLARRLTDEGKTPAAATLLADGIRKFPDEGRYVPKVLDELERLCQTIEGGAQVLIPFYASFLPTIPQKRGGSPSKYCLEMYRRAVKRFQDAGRADLAQRYQLEIAKLESISK